ncbi:MAG: hypothetical protein WDO19_24790 [Bacteroidota bacterium]
MRKTNWDYAAPVKRIRVVLVQTGRDLCMDASGNVYVIGIFNGFTDFDLNSATADTYNASSIDGYIASYTKNGFSGGRRLSPDQIMI